jgi:hypothetical protein
MPSPLESRAALQLLTSEAVNVSVDLLSRLQGSPEAKRFALLEATPELIGYYSEGSAALAADFYEEERELAGVRGRFTPDLVITDRTVKQRRAIAWAAQPLIDDVDDALSLVGGRMGELIQLEVARPFRDTITTNRRQDPRAVGWRRITAGGCGFCRMLAGRGAVYKESTARFAAHRNCHCVAQPVFDTGEVGEEASAMQYMASKRSHTPAQRASLRDFLSTYYPD